MTHVAEVRELGRWAAQWDDLVASMALPSPFLRAWWLEAVSDDSDRFVLALDGDRLIGGLPLRARHLPGLTMYRFAGPRVLAPDHMDLVAAPDDDAAAAAIRGWARDGNKLFDLDGLSDTSQLHRVLPLAKRTESDVAPWQPLPATVEEYIAQRPRTMRRKTNYTRNRLSHAGITGRRVDESTLDAALDEFATMLAQLDGRAGLLAELPTVRAFVTSGLRNGEIWVDVLEAPDRAVGVAISFAVAGRVSMYQMSRVLDVDNTSNALLLAVIERACELGFSEVDMLRGAEGYKHYYTECERTLYRIRAAHGPIGVAAFVAIRMAVWAKAKRTALDARRNPPPS